MTAAAAYAALSALREEGRRCRALWAAALLRALLNANRRDRHGESARAWLRKPNPLLLDLLDLDLDGACVAFARLAAAGQPHGQATDV